MINIMFYFFASIMLLFAFIAQTAKQDVSRVFSLVVSFFAAAILTVILNAEFVATIIVIVYMGAIAMLFVFVVMIIGDNSWDNYKNLGYKRILMYSVLSFGVFASLMSLILRKDNIIHEVAGNYVYTTKEVGYFLYQDNSIAFILVAIALFVAMIGIVVISKEMQYKVVKNTTKFQGVSMVDVKSGDGVKL